MVQSSAINSTGIFNESPYDPQQRLQQSMRYDYILPTNTYTGYDIYIT